MVFAILAGASSCNTSKNLNSGYSIYDLWSGTEVAKSDGVRNAYSLCIYKDGTLTFQGIAAGVEHFGTGTWSLSGTLFKCKVVTKYGIRTNVGVVQDMQINYNGKKGTLIGTRENENFSYHDEGSVSLKKVQ